MSTDSRNRCGSAHAQDYGQSDIPCHENEMLTLPQNENYGFKQEDRTHKGVPEITISGPGRLGGEQPASLCPLFQLTQLSDKRIWALTLVTCCFEGTNFILIFFWPSVLQDAHKPETNDLPYGVIFATFMAAMIIGAQFFHATSSPRLTPRPDSLKTPVVLLLAAVLLAAVSLLLLAVFRRSGETPQYAVFLLFELANGVYIPSMAYIRGLVVDEQSRAGLYGLMRLPLFVFVILALGITAEGKFSCLTWLIWMYARLTISMQTPVFESSSSGPHHFVFCWPLWHSSSDFVRRSMHRLRP